MYRIQFYFKPDTPVSYDTLKTRVSEEDFSRFFSRTDKTEIDSIWNDLKKQKVDKVFSQPRGLGCLCDTQDNIFTFGYTDFKTYIATTRSSGARTLSQGVYDNMRASAVGGLVRLSDGNVFIHRRSKNATHVAGIIDSSIGGLCQIKNAHLDFKATLTEKLKRELNVNEDEIESLYLTAVHSSSQPDFSGMVDFIITLPYNREQLEKKFDSSQFEETFFIPYKDLPDFIVSNFTSSSPQMVGDGCATLLSGLENEVFKDTVGKIQSRERLIQFGSLNQGEFIPD